MSFPELTAFSRQLKDSDPKDRDEHRSNLDRVREIAAYLRTKDLGELVSCLNASEHLIEGLSVSSGVVDPELMHRLACRLIDAVEVGLEELMPPAPPVEVETEVPMPDLDSFAIGDDDRGEAASTESNRVDSTALRPEFPEINDMVLGRMLVELGHVTRQQVAEALRMHRSQGMAIGECLLMIGATSPERLLETLRIQEKVRGLDGGSGASADKGMSPAQQAAAQAMAAMGGPVNTAANPSPKPKQANAAMRVTKDIFIGEVLLGAEMIDNDQLEKAMHVHHHTGTRVGEALVQMGALTEDDIESGLELQRQLRFIAGLPKHVG